MMITDGQLLYEGWVYGGGSSSSTTGRGLQVILGTGAMLDGPALVTACRSAGLEYYFSNTTLKTYLKTTLARTICVDASFANISDTMLKGGYIYAPLSKATATPTILVSGSPTWGIMMCTSYSSVPLPNGAACLTNATMYYYSRLYLFSVGATGSGADLILPGDGSLTADQVFRMSDIKIPITNVIA